jgi:nitrite reductase/ring-hydroxylating ferredoxin subunit
VVGSWTSALILDLVGGEGAGPAADRLVAAGVIAAVPTAAAGLSDWAELTGGTRRLGSVHALGNTTALLLHAASWIARKRGNRRRGVALSALGFAIASFSAWLGGHLSFGLGVGVNQTVFDEAPEKWTAVLDEAELPDNELVGTRADGTGVLLLRRGSQIYALADRCSHRGCPLHEGTLNGDTVTCNCHGSTFRLDGTVAKGPASSPQPRYDARIENARIEIRRPSGA